MASNPYYTLVITTLEASEGVGTPWAGCARCTRTPTKRSAMLLHTSNRALCYATALPHTTDRHTRLPLPRVAIGNAGEIRGMRARGGLRAYGLANTDDLCA